MAQICQMIVASVGGKENLKSFILDFNDNSVDEDEVFVFERRKIAMMKAERQIAKQN